MSDLKTIKAEYNEEQRCWELWEERESHRVYNALEMLGDDVGEMLRSRLAAHDALVEAAKNLLLMLDFHRPNGINEREAIFRDRLRAALALAREEPQP